MALLGRRSCIATHLGEDMLTKRARTSTRERHGRKGKAEREAARDAELKAQARAAELKALRLAAAKEEAARLARAAGRVVVDEDAVAAAREIAALEAAVVSTANDLRQANADVDRMREQLASTDEGLAATANASTQAIEVGQCPVCSDTIDRPAITPCQHVVCDDCASTVIASAAVSGREPLCPVPDCCKPFQPGSLLRGTSDAPAGAVPARSLSAREPSVKADAPAGAQPLGASSSARSVGATPIDDGTMQALERQAQALRHATAELSVLQNQFGSKVAELVRRLADIKAEEPDAKVVVFSQWVGVLEVVSEAIGSCGVVSKRLVSSSSSDTLSSFRSDPMVSVLLVSTKQGGGAAGLTLTMAHHLFLMEPSTNVGLEDQATARVHRIGQRRPVTVHRLLTRDSVEEGILTVQERKRGTKASRSTSGSEALSLLDVCRIFKLFSDDDDAAAVTS
jgi:E3 ubiquitin-protein ligase SHPRH